MATIKKIIANSKTIQVRILREDLDKLLNHCKDLYVADNPEFKNIKLPVWFMANKVIKYYIDN